MTNEEIQLKADELSQKHNCKVHPLVFVVDPSNPDNQERVIGFIKEPPRHVKLRVMDKGLSAPMTAAAEVVDAYLIREESDKRIMDEGDDLWYLGAAYEAYNLIKMGINQFKKK